MSETQLEEFLDSESSSLITNLAFTAMMTGFTILLMYYDVYPTIVTGKIVIVRGQPTCPVSCDEQTK